MATYKLFSSDGDFIDSFKYRYESNNKRCSVEFWLTENSRSNDTYIVERWEDHTMVKKERVQPSQTSSD